MENGNMIVVKKGNGFFKLVKILLAIAAVAFVAVKIYQKIAEHRAKKLAAEEVEEELLDCGTEEEAVEEEIFEAPAEAVIANAADMEA